MAFYNVSESFGVDKAILAYARGTFAQRSVSVNRDYITPDANNNYRRSVPAGLFVAEIGSNQYRFLPRTKTSEAITTSSPNASLGKLSYLFKTNDVLYAVEPYAVINLGGSIANGQVLTVTVGGRPTSINLTSGVVGDQATVVANGVNSAPYLSSIVKAVADVVNGKVVLLSWDGVTEHPLSISGTAVSTGGTSIAGSVTKLTTNATPIGTIASINGESGTATLTSNASAALPAGVNIGVYVNNILGLHVHSVDYTSAEIRDLALYTEALGVRIHLLPYFDGDIARRFPNMQFDYRF